MMRRSRRWELNHPERKSQILEIAVRRIKKATRSSISFQGYARFDNSSDVVKSSVNFLESSGQTENVSLPPISGGKIPAALPLHLKEPRCFKNLPGGDRMKETTQFYVLGTQCGRTKEEFKQSNKSKVVQNKKETSSRRTKEVEDQLEPADQHTGDEDQCEERPQRDFCSDDSAETESEESGGRPEGKQEDGNDDEEYYSNERIAKWVLKVNSSLFSTGSNDTGGSKSAEEQDVATIKIIYSGD